MRKLTFVAVACMLLAVGTAAHAAPLLEIKIGDGLAGSFSEAGGTYTIMASGSDIWGNADDFYYVYQEFPGGEDLSLECQVMGFTGGTNSWRKAGPMIRDSLSDRSRNAMSTQSFSNGLRGQWRTSTGGGSGSAGPGGNQAPTFMKLTYTAATNSFAYQYKENAADPWSTITGNHTVNMSGTVFMGLAVTSHNSGQQTTVDFTNVVGFEVPDAAYISQANGNWNTPGTWLGSPPAPPTTLSDVLVDGETVTVAAPSFAGALDVTAGSVDLNDTLTIRRSINVSGTGALNLGAGGTLAAGVVCGGNIGTLNVTGDGTIANEGNLAVSGATFDGGGNTATFTKTGSGILTLDNSGATGVIGTQNMTFDVQEGMLHSNGENPLGGASGGGEPPEVILSGGTLSVEGAVTTTLTDAILHFGYHINNDGLALNLDNNRGMMGGGDPYSFQNFEGQGLLTDGPGNRGLDFNNDGDFRAVPAIVDDASGDGWVIDRNDNYSNLWVGVLEVTPANAGTWTFRNAGDDDRGGIWLDLDQDGVFESSTPGLGSNRGEQISYEDGGTKTFNLTPGHYGVAFTHREGGGGSRADFRISSPAFGVQTVRPAVAAQLGLWSVSSVGPIDMRGTTFTVTADSELRASTHEGPAAFGPLALNDGTTLTTSGADMTFTTIDIPGGAGRSAALAPQGNQQVTMARYDDRGDGATFIKDGTGTLLIDNADGNVHAGDTTFRVDRGTLSASGGDPLGGSPALVLNGGMASFGDGLSPPVAPTNGLVAHWALDETSGTIAVDSVGVHDGALHNGPVWQPTGGKFGGALDFDGSNDYADVASLATYFNGKDAITFSAWIKSDSVAQDRGFFQGADLGAFRGQDRWGIRYDDAGATGGGDDVFKVGLAINGTTNTYQYESAAGVQTTEWQHVAMVWESGNGFQLYVDGILDTPTANSFGTVAGTLSNQTHFIFGDGAKNPWRGLMDEIRVYDRALTPTEASNLFAVRTEADLTGVDILVSANSTLDSRSASTLNIPIVRLNNNTRLTTTGGDMALDTLVLNGARGTLAPQNTLTVKNYADGGSSATVVMDGPGTLAIDNSAGGIVAPATTFEVAQGTLDGGAIANPLAGGALLLTGGTFHMEGAPGVGVSPGLLAGSHSGNPWTGNPNPGNLGAVLGPQGTLNRNGPRGAESNAHWSAPRDDGGNGPGNTTLIYSGEIYLPGTVTFAEHIDDRTMIWVNNTQIMNDGAWNNAASATFTPPGGPGWYDFEVRFSNGGGGYGFTQQGQGGGDSNWNVVDYGFGIAAGTVAGENALDYTYPEDPGDASLFRHTGAINLPINEPGIHVTVDGGGTIDAVSTTTATFGNLTLEDGTLTTSGAFGGISFASTTMGWLASNVGVNTLVNANTGAFDASQSALDATFTKTGPADLVLNGPVTGTEDLTFDVQGGRLVTPSSPVALGSLRLSGGTVDTAGNDVTISNDLKVGGATYTAAGGSTFGVRGSDVASERTLVLDGSRLELAAPALPGAMHNWRFDEAVGATVAVDSIGGSDGNVNGNPVFQPGGGQIGGALLLDGSGDFVTVPGGANRVDIDNKSFSASFWANRDTTNSDYVLGQGDSGSTRSSLHIGFRDNNTFTHAFWGDDLNWDNAKVTDTSNWHHWVATYDADTNTQRLYADGVLVDTEGTSGDFSSNGSNDFWIGRRRDGNNFAGLLDDVWIFDHPLTQAEIDILFRAPTEGYPTGISQPDTDILVTGDSTLAVDTEGPLTLGDLAIDLESTLELEMLEIIDGVTSVFFNSLDVLDPFGARVPGQVYTLMELVDANGVPGTGIFDDQMFGEAFLNGIELAWDIGGGTLSYGDGSVVQLRAYIPEPGTMVLLGVGLLGLARRRRRKKH